MLRGDASGGCFGGMLRGMIRGSDSPRLHFKATQHNKKKDKPNIYIYICIYIYIYGTHACNIFTERNIK